MIHVFHGFLGSLHDFAFLKGETVKLYDLYQMTPVEIEEDDVLIGYSLGGRIAMKLAVANGFHFRKLVIINSHPGLPGDVKERNLWEESVIERMKKLNASEFLDYWNGLPLFKQDRPLNSLSEEKLKASIALFEEHRLSRQQNYLPELKVHKEKVLWISGRADEKYQAIAEELVRPLGIKCYSLNGGHRLYQNPDDILSILKEEGIL